MRKPRKPTKRPWRRQGEVLSLPASPMARTPWLSDAEELLNAIIGFTARLFGSLFLGLGALLSKEPLRKLEALESTGKILPWNLLLLTASATFSGLFSTSFEYAAKSEADWIQPLLGLVKTETYLERFVPTLCVGLILIMSVWLSSAIFRKRDFLAGLRQLVAITYFLTLLCSLAAAASISFFDRFTLVTIGNTAVDFRLLKVLATFFPLYGVAVAVILTIPIGLVCCIMLARSALSTRWHGLSRVTESTIKGILATSGMIFGISTPSIIFLMVIEATSLLSPFIKTVIDTPAAEKDPFETATFYPYPTHCAVSEANGIKDLECAFVSRTGGSGLVLLESNAQIFIFVREPNPFGLDRFRLRKSNEILASYSKDHPDEGTKTVKVDDGTLRIESIPAAWGGVSVLELGKPLYIVLKLPLPGACSGTLGEYFNGGHAKEASDVEFDGLFVRVKPLRPLGFNEEPMEELGEDLQSYAAIGPFNLPMDAYNQACAPHKPS